MRKPSEAAAYLLVILIGGIWGYFCWQTYLIPVTPPTYWLDFGDSDVITASQPTSKAFFRKTVHLPTPVRHAWVAVAASDAFTLYVNEVQVAKVLYPTSVVQNIYDLSPFLVVGKNVVALEVTRSTYPEPAWMRLMGGYTTWAGQPYTLKSDLTWKAHFREDNLLRAGQPPLRWYAVAFDDVRWHKARVYPHSQVTRYPVALQGWPLLYRTPPQGPWLWDPGGEALGVRLSRSLSLPFPGPRRVWVRISGLSPFRLSLNGQTAALRPQPEKGFHLYDLTPLIRWGENLLVLEVHKGSLGIGVIADLFVERASGEVEVLQGDTGWTALTGPGRQRLAPPVPLAPYPSFPGFPLAQNPRTLLYPWWHPWWYGGTALFCAVLAAFLTLGHWRLWAVLWQRSGDAMACRRFLAFFHWPTGLFLAAMFFLQFDISFPADWPFQTWVVLTALGLLLAGQLLGGGWYRWRKSS